jgi:serine/threonine-protein kinase
VPATPTPRTIEVPQLRGKTLDDARAALQAVGLTMTVKGANVNADKNVVADQSPDAGATVQPNGSVMVTVGSGSTPIPDVAGKPREQAAKLLSDNSFRVTVRERRDNRVPAGTAIETRPAAGMVTPRGSDVELWISQGR